jgi:cytochrome c biogenesis protein
MIIKLFTYLRSVQFFILTLVILGIIAILGILIPQGWEHSRYLQKYGNIIAALIIKARWYHIFSSFWFIIPLCAFSFNLVFCIFSRLVSLIKIFFIAPIKTAADIPGDKTKAAQKESPSLDNTLSSLEDILKARHFRTHSNQDTDTVFIAAQKNRVGILGSLLLHLGLLLLVAGGIVQYYMGDTAMAVLSKGAKEKIDKLTIQIRMEDFSIVKNEKGDLINYQTDLEILDTTGKTLKAGNTTVNAPLKFKNLYFYQVHYRYVPDAVKSFHAIITDSLSNDTVFNGHIPFNKKYNLDKQNISILCNAFFCDFVFDLKGRKAFNRSNDHKNPAFGITLFQNDSLINSQWIFTNVPSPHGSHGQYNVTIPAYDPAFFSGIEIRKKPGTPVIWMAIIMVSIGMLVVFLLPFRELFLTLTRKEDTTSLTLIQAKPGNTEWFEHEAEEIIQKWKGSE